MSKPLSSWRQELKALITLMTPILVTQLAQAGYGFIDTVMAGQVSPLDLAAVAIGSSVWLPLFLLISGIVMATTPLVAAAYGTLFRNPQDYSSILMAGFNNWRVGHVYLATHQFYFPPVGCTTNSARKNRTIFIRRVIWYAFGRHFLYGFIVKHSAILNL